MNNPITIADYCSEWFIDGHKMDPSSPVRELTPEQVIASYGALDFDQIELNDSYWAETPAETLRQLCSEIGKPIFSYNFPVDLVVDPKANAAVLEHFRHVLDRIHTMQAQYGMVFPALLKTQPDFATQRAWLVENLAAAVELARTAGIVILAENCDYPPLRPFMGSGADCASIYREINSPHFKLIFDCCAGVFVHETWRETFDAMSPYMVHTHIKNTRRVAPDERAKTLRYLDSNDGTRYTGTLLPDGVIDIPAVCAAFREVGYTGTISIEYQGTERPVEALKKNIQYYGTL